MNVERKKKIVIFFIFLAIIIGFYLLINIINIIRYKGNFPSDIIYMSDVESNINYDVYLKPNSFIKEEYIGNDYSFITSLVEYIKTTFSYKYKGNNDISIDYDYYIEAIIISNHSSDKNNVTKPLWRKTFMLLDHKTGTSSNSNITIEEVLNIDTDYYDNIVKDFNQTINIPLDSHLDITFTIAIKGQLKNKKTLAKEHSLTMTIPLGVKAFDINVVKNFPNHEVEYSKEQPSTSASYMLAIIYIALIVVIIAIVTYLIKKIINRDRNEYEGRVNDILKQYDDRIVTVNTFIRYEKLDIVDLPSFEELLTLSDETLEPIIYWEKTVNKNKESWFSIIRDKVVYRYAISFIRKH